jgi:hypothetical protein
MEEDKIIIGRKGVDMAPGIIFAPYISLTSTTIIHGYGTRNISRKRKINKIFKLELDIDDGFQPSKSISSRYAKKIVNNNFYGVVTIK